VRATAGSAPSTPMASRWRGCRRWRPARRRRTSVPECSKNARLRSGRRTTRAEIAILKARLEQLERRIGRQWTRAS